MFRILELTTNCESITDYDIHCTVHCCFNFNTQRTDLTFDPKVHRNQCTMYSGSLKHFRNLQCIRKKNHCFSLKRICSSSLPHNSIHPSPWCKGKNKMTNCRRMKFQTSALFYLFYYNFFPIF